MRPRRGITALSFALLALGCRREAVAPPEPVQVAAGIDHAEWERLLSTYVDEGGLVGYAAWKASTKDLRALDAYLLRLAADPIPPAQGSDRAASLINAYNAFTIRWILDNYPTTSIMALPHSFVAARHRIGGRKVSLDAIEHQTLRGLVGYRVHAAIVCAARSCSPLSREAYRAERLDEQLDAAMARWLARGDLNRFSGSRAEVSEVFKWFAEDFEKAGGLRGVLEKHGPPSARASLERPDLRIEYLRYDWSLNDRAGGAGSYGRLRRLRDWVRDRLRP